MGFFSAIKGMFSTKAMDSSQPGSYPSTWLEASDSFSDEPINSWTILRQTTVLQCVTLISNGIAQVPFRLMKKGHKLAEDNPLFYLLRESPNRWQSAFDFWKLIGFHLALQGNVIVWVVRVRGIIQELIPFPPHKYMVNVNYDGGWMKRTFVLIKDDGSTVEVPEKDIWELRWRDWDINIGIPQLDLVRSVVGIAIAGDKLSGSSMQNGCQLSGLLLSKQVLKPDQYKEIQEQWHKQYGGSQNAGKTAILGADFSYQATRQTNSDAQFIEQKKFQIEEICRAWNINPLLVFHLENTASYSNAEQMMVQHVTHTMAPWYTMIESSAYRNLLTDEQRRKEGLFFAFNDAALMRTDQKSRAEFYSKMFNIGSITPNEIRALEDMPPKEGGDELYIQGAVVPLKNAGEWQKRGLSQEAIAESDNQDKEKDNPDNSSDDENPSEGDENE